MKKIVCPYCGYEYSPEEIYIPEAFFGRAKNIERDNAGKIIYFVGKGMDLNESYRCDKCNTKFKVKCDLKFYATSEAKDFSNSYSTKINKPNLFMSED